MHDLKGSPDHDNFRLVVFHWISPPLRFLLLQLAESVDLVCDSAPHGTVCRPETWRRIDASPLTICCCVTDRSQSSRLTARISGARGTSLPCRAICRASENRSQSMILRQPQSTFWLFSVSLAHPIEMAAIGDRAT